MHVDIVYVPMELAAWITNWDSAAMYAHRTQTDMCMRTMFVTVCGVCVQNDGITRTTTACLCRYRAKFFTHITQHRDIESLVYAKTDVNVCVLQSAVWYRQFSIALSFCWVKHSASDTIGRNIYIDQCTIQKKIEWKQIQQKEKRE